MLVSSRHTMINTAVINIILRESLAFSHETPGK